MIGDYGFDANGNWLGAGGSQINTWNVENQLISNGSLDGSGNPLTYTYDPWGKRVLQYSVSGRLAVCRRGRSISTASRAAAGNV
jgi:YD repeat-containing protein